jgi:predicted transcriptional regulator
MGNKKGTYRDRYQIVADMLEHVKKGKTKKSHFLCKCNLSFRQAKNYLNVLLGANLIEIDHSNGVKNFQITDKGSDFLGRYRELSGMMNDNNPIPNGSIAPYANGGISRPAQAYK